MENWISESYFSWFYRKPFQFYNPGKITPFSHNFPVSWVIPRPLRCHCRLHCHVIDFLSSDIWLCRNPDEYHQFVMAEYNKLLLEPNVSRRKPPPKLPDIQALPPPTEAPTDSTRYELFWSIHSITCISLTNARNSLPSLTRHQCSTFTCLYLNSVEVDFQNSILP